MKSIEELLTSKDFNEEQRHQIRLGVENGFTLDQINAYARPEYSAEQMNELAKGFYNGLSMEQVNLFANPKYDWFQMSEIRLGLQNGLSAEKVKLYADPDIDFSQMRQSREILESQLSFEQNSADYERFAVPIEEIFKDKADVLKTLYSCMNENGMQQEANVYFAEMLKTMKAMEDRIISLNEFNKELVQKVNELEHNQNLNHLVVAQAKDIASATHREYEHLKQNYHDAKESIIESAKNTIQFYLAYGKNELVKGITGIGNMFKSINAFAIKSLNREIEARKNTIERLDEIGKELAATSNQIKNLFRTISGRGKTENIVESNVFTTYLQNNLKAQNEKDINTVNSFMRANERIEEFNTSLRNKLSMSGKGKSLDNLISRAEKVRDNNNRYKDVQVKDYTKNNNQLAR